MRFQSGKFQAGSPAEGRVVSAASRRAGVTLLEILIYVGVIAVLGYPLVSVVLVSTRTAKDHDTFNRLAERNRSALYRVTREIRRAIGDTVNVPSADTLEFTLPQGFDGVQVVPGPVVRYRFEIAPDEQMNGKDDNGNGLADEGQLARTNLDTGETAVICLGLDLAVCRFEVNARAVTATISNQGRLVHGNARHTLTRSLTVIPRN